MNEHDMISNISYIMHLYPETTEKILIEHGADPSKEYWTDGCDIAGAYDELLQWLNSRYDRNDRETELDYHIQEILGWHDVNESSEYVATAAALDREDIIEHLLDVSEESGMQDRIFNKCEVMIKQYKIPANPDWDLPNILDTFTTKQLQELLQYMMDNYNTESLTEDSDTNVEIPAPYNQYYEFSPDDVNYDELPDAFDNYRDLKVVAELYAKEQYEDALANNGLEFCWLVSDNGRLMLVTTAGPRVYPITIEEVLECVGLNEDSVDWRSRKASVDTVELDSQINRVIKGIDLDGRVPKIMKRHYKPNFVRYDIGIGTVGQRAASDYESRVAIPAYEHMRDAFEKQGWKVFFQPSVGMRGDLSWTDFYVQVRIPYSSISNGTKELDECEEIQGCVGKPSCEHDFGDFDESYTGEPSSSDYGKFITSYYNDIENVLTKYGIRRITRRHSTDYVGTVNDHSFFFVEGNTGTGHYAKELYIDDKEVNLYQSKESERSFAYLNEMNQFGILSLVKMLENNNLSGIVYRDVDDLDDYAEGLVEDVEMFGRAKRKNSSTVMHESVESTINDYKRSRDIDIDTTLACNRSIQVGNSRAPVDTVYIQFQSSLGKYPSLVGYAHLDNGGYDHEYLSATDIRNYDLSRYMNGTDITDLEGMLRDNPSILFESTAIDLSEAHEYDDYEESLVESTEMSDAQRLALQELDSALNCGEVTQEERDAGQNIQWDINFEDVVLFISGIDVPLNDVKHVAYGDCDETQFDGCYSVTLNNGKVKRYGWHDFDMTGSLTCIDCNDNINEGADGWEKPFNWTERYVKDGFVISNNYQGAWHLEQTRPKTKHIGNYKSLEAAKAAGDTEINKRNAKNKDKPVQFGVHSFTSDSIVFRGTEGEYAEYINKNGLENEAEIYMMNANDRHYLDEAAGKRFNNGDRVYVTVNNRQGNVTKMISNDVVEVEFEANGTYPARIDRYYVDEVELIFSDDLDDDF